MMSMDREALQEYLEQLADRFYGHEIVERLEEANVLTVRDIIACLEDFIIEGKEYLER